MKILESILEEYNNWIGMEIQSAKPLDGGYLTAFYRLSGISPEYTFRNLHFNKTAIIVTDIDDFIELTENTQLGLECTFKMESDQLNINLYVLSFVENKGLNTLLGGAS